MAVKRRASFVGGSKLLTLAGEIVVHDGAQGVTFRIGSPTSVQARIATARDLAENCSRLLAGVGKAQHEIESHTAAATARPILNQPRPVTALGDHQAKAGLFLIPINGTLG